MKSLSRTDFAFVFLVLLLATSASAWLELPSFYHPVYSLHATKLDEKPQKYFVLDNPDAYVLQALLNPGKHVPVGSLDDTQIDDMESDYGTNNVQFNNTYFEVDFVYGDIFPPAGLPLLVLASLVFSATSILVIGLFKIAQHLKKMKGLDGAGQVLWKNLKH